jgi:hypothetical protein
MSKPSEKAMQLQDGFYFKYCDGTDDGMEGFHYFTVRCGKVLPSLPIEVIEKAKKHITRQTLTEHQRVVEMAEKALAQAEFHLAVYDMKLPTITEALAEIAKLRKE